MRVLSYQLISIIFFYLLDQTIVRNLYLKKIMTHDIDLSSFTYFFGELFLLARHCLSHRRELILVC